MAFAATQPGADNGGGIRKTRFFEDLKVGERLVLGGIVVDPAEAAEFARRYDAGHAPQPRIHYSGGGPQISPWLVAALSWRMLDDIAAASPVEEAKFSRPSELEWQHSVSPGDVLRIEVEVTELLSQNAIFRKHGSAQVRLNLFATGPRGLGTYYEDEGEMVENVALTYLAQLQARRGSEVRSHDSVTGKLMSF